MPITVNYEPPAALVGSVAYGSGLGEYAQQQRELAQRHALEQAHLAQQQAQFAAGANMRMYENEQNRQSREQLATERNQQRDDWLKVQENKNEAHQQYQYDALDSRNQNHLDVAGMRGGGGNNVGNFPFDSVLGGDGASATGDGGQGGGGGVMPPSMPLQPPSTGQGGGMMPPARPMAPMSPPQPSMGAAGAGQGTGQVEEPTPPPVQPGDVNGGMPLAHEVMHQGIRANENQQAASFPSQKAIADLEKRINSGDPYALQEGLQRGIVQYTPEQKTQLRKIQGALGELNNNAQLSPQDKQRARMELNRQLQGIKPMLTPIDERPPTNDQRFESNVTIRPHPYEFERDASGQPVIDQSTGRPRPKMERWFVPQDRNKPPVNLDAEADKEAARARATAAASADKHVKDYAEWVKAPDNFNKAYAETQRELTTADHKSSDGKTTIPGSVPTHQEIIDQMKRKQKAHQEFNNPPATPDPWGIGDAAKNFFQGVANQAQTIPGTGQAGNVPTQPQQQPPQQQQTIQGIPVTPAVIYTPKTKADVDAIPKGATFIAPDGTRRVK